VRCDSDPHGAPARQDEVMVEIGLSLRRPGDFRVLRISHHAAEAA